MSNLFIGSLFNNFLKQTPQKHIALFASGGGNDVFSAMTYASHLKQQNYAVKIYSMLGITPYHLVRSPISLIHEQSLIPATGQLHRYLIHEQPLIPATNHLYRYLPMKTPVEIRNTEHTIPQMLKHMNLVDVPVSLISPKYRPQYLAQIILSDLEHFCTNLSDLICIVCDFGGDILCNGEASTFSPELDAICLNIVSMLNIKNSFVLLSWLGIDGELSSNILKF
jgi:hypothetical protein